MAVAAPPPPAVPARVAVAPVADGRSVEGRPLRLVRRGSADAPVRVLVVGQIHGDEPGGRRVVTSLRAQPAPEGAAIYSVATVNPDGALRRTRVNAHGVDLNRNFPASWRRGRRGRFWPGPRAGSEPETRWVQAVVRAVRPQVTVWLHQPYGVVDSGGDSDPAIVRAYARRVRLAPRALPRYFGTATRWQHALFPSAAAFVVELGASRPADAVVGRHVAAVLGVAQDLVAATVPAPAPTPQPVPSPTPSS